MKLDFNKRKFFNLLPEQQHKKCAELLRYIFENLIQGISTLAELEAYNEIAHWLNEPTLSNIDRKSIADRYHQHISRAKISHKEHNLLPSISIRQGDRALSEKPWPIAIYLDKIRSAHNVGSILRTVEAFSLGTVYFSEQTPFVDHKQVQDAAMGAGSWIQCHRDTPLEALPKPIIAMETSGNAISLFDFIFPETFTLVLGNEEYGCSDLALQAADCIIEIPLRGHKNSLNVANAFAIASAEIVRQRKCN